MSSSGYAVFVGLDVAKSEHHATALDPEGTVVRDKALPNSEDRLRQLFDQLGERGTVLVVVDQPASIGALPVAVARECGAQVAYLPGLTMRRLADTHPGRGKTDARDAHVIADAARTLPHTLRRVDTGDESMAELDVLVGFDDDLAAEVTRVTNRIRGLLTQVHPALERVLGPKLDHPAVLEMLACHGGPQGLAAAGADQLGTIARERAPRVGQRLVADVMTALGEQTVTVPGTAAAEQVLPRLAGQLRQLHEQRKHTATEVERILDAHPLAPILTSLPGFGVRTTARVLLAVGDGSAFRGAAHLAAYAGLAPVTRRSGHSIRGEHPDRGGNKKLKRALYLAAFSSLHADPASRAYYDRKRSEGKPHKAALICLARRKTDVLYAMLRDRTPYRPTPTAA